MSEPVEYATVIWEQLATKIETFAAAWREAEAPPEMADFLPTEPPELRQLLLLELVKYDLEQRWNRAGMRKTIEQYLAEWPELRQSTGTNDLIYEEYHVRKQCGDTIAPDDYARRFPGQGEKLQELLAIENPHLTTSCAKLGRAERFEPGTTIDDFDLISKLGEGAFAAVFLARQRSLGRLVAVKISNDRGLETQTLVRLDHPNIVRVFDQRRLPERQLLLMYMQYLSGGTLRAVADRVCETPVAERTGKLVIECVDARLRALGETPPSDSRTRQLLASLSWPETVAWLGARLAAALEHAHQHGVLHRDLKPANVLLAAECSPSLVDFNVSSCTDVPGAAADAFFGGTLAYMSPEQLEACLPNNTNRSEKLDGRTDIFSLGVVLWELLTGERPFHNEGIVDLTTHTLEKMLVQRRGGLTAAELAQLPKRGCAGLLELLTSCLAADRNERPASAAALSRQLALCLRPELQALLRPPRASWMAHARRHPLPLFIVAGLLPNVCASIFSIAYNKSEIIDKHENPAVKEIFKTQLMSVNSVAYAIGVAIMVVVCWPVLRAVKHHLTGKITADELARCRVRSLIVGDVIALVSGLEWLISGLLFPISLHLSLGVWTALTPHEYLHWFASQAICGSLAATMSFFLITRYATTTLTPPLLDLERGDEPLRVALDRLAWRTPLYNYLALVTFPLAMIVIPLMNPASQFTFVVLGLVGMLCSILAFRLAKHIQQTLAALRVATNADDQLVPQR